MRLAVASEPKLASDRLLELFAGRGWARRRFGQGLRRLRSILEEDEAAAAGRRSPEGRASRASAFHFDPDRFQPNPRIVPRMRLRPLVLLALLVVLAGALGACGTRSRDLLGRGLAEGDVLDVGGLKYQVQISRELNPTDSEDRAYLVGLAPTARDLKPDETWFAVFLRVQYDTKDGAPRPTAREFTLEDTQRDVYRPVPLAADNVFAYRADHAAADGDPPGRRQPRPPRARSRARCCCSGSRTPTSRTGR